ncbi:VOC family protein [Agromyces sp. CFH 90414]|uniref:VOC family protein n=1 Tax=Agromyces agglutinans TaxID=2662258 RepID=A0A6I2F8F9_9MICO|nr:VOC family protein [Agromyces agglutinans]MRG59060.1 VOC family protein [Agromyces agglutinans]
MTEYFNAFEISPVPDGPDAVAPEPFLGIYAMPMFVKIPTRDLHASTDFWVRGLGFVDLFNVPGQIVHLRRWAFQDVLLVPADDDPAPAGDAAAPPAAGTAQVFVSCVLGQLESVADACRALSPDSVTGPYDTAWRTRDIAVITPEGAHVTFTAATPFTPDSDVGRDFASVGIFAPDDPRGGAQ